MSRHRVLATALAVLLAVPFAATSAVPQRKIDLVDPMIGTMGSGFVFPGPSAPYGMVQLSPDTDGYFAYTGYQYIDTAIRGFSHVHVESMGVREGGHVPLMPTVGAVDTDVMTYASPFEHATEVAKPGYYAVTLANSGVRAELTAGTRVGMHRYTFPATSEANVLIDAGRQIGGDDEDGAIPRSNPGAHRALVNIVDDRTVMGTSDPDATGSDRYGVHFAIRFSRPFIASGTWGSRGADPTLGATSVDGKGAGGFVTFDASVDQTVIASVGISFVSQANAMVNLETELAEAPFDFNALRGDTEDAWDDALAGIDVAGGTPAQQRAFTTALFHAQQHPNVFNDVNGDYRGYDHQTHRIGAPGDPMPAGTTMYANFSMWDTYRAEMPLLMLIAPDRVKDMMRSLAAIVVQGGRLPRWGLMDRYADFMNGEPALQVVSDAYCRGLVPPEVEQTLYSAMRTSALVNRRDPSYLSLGYIPAPGSGASGTLEHALGDFALALVADAKGETADRDQLLNQAGNWRNHFDPSTRFLRPRLANGTWFGNPYLPEMPDGWREGTGWQYTWLVPHDPRGLFDAMGGADGDGFVTGRLDTFFAGAQLPIAGPEVQQKITGFGIAYYGNQYAPSNEHDLQAPWLYNWIGQPWKTQGLVRNLQGLYRDTPDGLPGNDDLGTMSAWFVWSALGFYPNTPGAPVYALGSPLFPSIRIHLANGRTVSIDAPNTEVAPYVASASLNGNALSKSWITHENLLEGSDIAFEMSAAPDLSQWAGVAAAPPSQSANALADFGCR